MSSLALPGRSAGGSLLNSLAPLASAKGLDWSKTHVFFVDERNVAHDSPDSNYRAAQEVLLSKVRGKVFLQFLKAGRCAAAAPFGERHIQWRACSRAVPACFPCFFVSSSVHYLICNAII